MMKRRKVPSKTYQPTHSMEKHIHAGPLPVLLSQEEGKFYAHCLPFDLIAEGNSDREAQSRLAEMIFEYIRFFAKRDMEPFIFRPAPMKYWQILKMLVNENARGFVPNLPPGLLQASTPNRVARYLHAVNAPAYT